MCGDGDGAGSKELLSPTKKVKNDANGKSLSNRGTLSAFWRSCHPAMYDPFPEALMYLAKSKR